MGTHFCNVSFILFMYINFTWCKDYGNKLKHIWNKISQCENILPNGYYKGYWMCIMVITKTIQKIKKEYNQSNKNYFSHDFFQHKYDDFLQEMKDMIDQDNEMMKLLNKKNNKDNEMMEDYSWNFFKQEDYKYTKQLLENFYNFIANELDEIS